MSSSLEIARPWLVLVSDRRRLCAAAGRPSAEAGDLLVEQARAAAAAGVTAVQVREPDLDARTLLALVTRIVAAAGSRLRVLVNDRADVAAALRTGVHLRASSMPVERLRRWLPPGTWITRAIHEARDLDAARGADAVIAGTVFATPSKPSTHLTLGLAGLARLAASTPMPVVAIGGLAGRDWPALRASGAAGLAAIGVFMPRPGETVAAAVQRAVADVSAVVDSPGGVT